MQTLSRPLLDAVPAASAATSATISGTYLSALSLQAVVAGGSGIVGALYVDGSNEEMPVNWYSPVGASISVSGNVSTGTVALGICYRWVRARWVPSVGTGGTISVAMMAQSGPSPTSPFASGLLETSGPTPLLMGAWADGLYARRSGDTIIGAAAGLPMEAAHLSSTAVANTFLTHANITGYTSGAAATNNVLRAKALTTGRNCTLIGLGVDCATGVANARARIGLWEAGPTGYPTTLIAESADFDCSTNTRKLTTGLSVPLSSAKTYYAGVLTGGATPNMAILNSATGSANVTCASGAIQVTQVIGISVAQVYGAMPATFPSGAAAVASSTVMIVPLLQVA